MGTHGRQEHISCQEQQHSASSAPDSNVFHCAAIQPLPAHFKFLILSTHSRKNKKAIRKEIFAAHVFEDYNHNRHQATYHQGQDTLDSSHSSL